MCPISSLTVGIAVVLNLAQFVAPATTWMFWCLPLYCS